LIERKNQGHPISPFGKIHRSRDSITILELKIAYLQTGYCVSVLVRNSDREHGQVRADPNDIVVSGLRQCDRPAAAKRAQKEGQDSNDLIATRSQAGSARSEQS
jgi:hypothetical protein